jgi:hypothetical protein
MLRREKLIVLSLAPTPSPRTNTRAEHAVLLPKVESLPIEKLFTIRMSVPGFVVTVTSWPMLRSQKM